ncbi:hypothetical protein BYT27DRAFT_6753527 [Phlegmacium glaucopus]|nr:hypothetical protein BYT27DRAFT_6753527 [Phlegmacium glaucopus]
MLWRCAMIYGGVSRRCRIALIVVLVVLGLSSLVYILNQSLVHVYVLSPLLIIYRVARGRSITFREQPSENGPAVSAIRFEPLPPSSGNIEV